MFFSSYFLSMLSPSSNINPCHSLFFDRDHLRFIMAVISGPGLRSGIISGPVQYPPGTPSRYGYRRLETV